MSKRALSKKTISLSSGDAPSEARFLPGRSCNQKNDIPWYEWYVYASRDMASEACVAEGCAGLGTQGEQEAM